MKKQIFMILVVLCIAASSLFAQDVPRAEVYGGYSLLAHVGDKKSDFGDEPKYNGWLASVNFNIKPMFGIEVEGSGQYGNMDILRLNIGNIRAAVDSNVKRHSFAAGPRVTFRQENFSPFVHALVGYGRASTNMSATYHMVNDGVEYVATGTNSFSTGVVTLIFGGGIDVNVNDKISIRVPQVDYIPSHVGDTNGTLSGTNVPYTVKGGFTHYVRVSAGIVFKIK